MLALRSLSVLEAILNQTDVFTFRDLAKQLNISEKTVRNQLGEVNNFFKRFNLRLVVVPGYGTHLEGSIENRQAARFQIEAAKPFIRHIQSRERIHIILYRLLMNQKPCYIQQLEEQLFVSRSSLYQDLKLVDSWLQPFQIDLIINRKQGISLVSGEKRIRLALVKLIEEIQVQQNLKLIEATQTEMGEWMHRMMDAQSKFRMNAIELLHRLENQSQNVFAKGEFERLVLHILVGFQRIQSQHTVNLRPELINRLENSLWVKFIVQQLPFIQEAFGIELSPNELYYYSGILLSSKFVQGSLEQVNYLLSDSQLIAQLFSQKVFEYCSIINKDKFIDDLTQHIYQVLQQSQFIWECHNPYTQMIKQRFPNSYKLASEIRPMIEDILNTSVPDDELAYIAMHIMAGIETSRTPLKTLFVYNQTYSEIKYALSIIKNHLNEVNIYAVVKVNELESTDLSEVDLILSSTPIELNTPIPIRIISVIPENNWLLNLSKDVMELFERVNDVKIIRKNPS